MVKPQQVSDTLGVPSSTLRLWAKEFEQFLDPGARVHQGMDGQRGYRRYSDADLALLVRVKNLLSEGLDYEEVRQRLADDPEGGGDGAGLSLALRVGTSPLVIAFQHSLGAKEEVIAELRSRVADKDDVIVELRGRLADAYRHRDEVVAAAGSQRRWWKRG